MIRWLMVVFLALVLINGLGPVVAQTGVRAIAGRFLFSVCRPRMFYSTGQHPALEYCIKFGRQMVVTGY